MTLAFAIPLLQFFGGFPEDYKNSRSEAPYSIPLDMVQGRPQPAAKVSHKLLRSINTVKMKYVFIW
jgi:hypothetical protein